MSVTRDDLSLTGFPFTPSRFKGLPQLGPIAPVAAPKVGRSPHSRVNSGLIDDSDGRRISDIPPSIVAHQNVFSTRARASRLTGLKLLPLASFVWGGRSSTPQPRTRAEHALLWVTRGMLKLDFPRGTHRLGAGWLHFVPAGTAFAVTPLANVDGQVLLLSPHLIHDLTHAFPTRPLGGQVERGDSTLWQLLHDLATEARRGTEHAHKIMQCNLSLLALQLERLSPPARPQRTLKDSHADLPLAERFLALARTRLGELGTISDLAHELGVTTTDLDHACRHKHGKRAIDMLNELRLRRAVELLRNTHDSPGCIARQLGFTSLAHLSRAFVSATGRLPEQFREPS